MSFTNFLENALMGHAFGGSAYTQPSEWFVKLHTGDPGEDATANAATEDTREEVTSWSAVSGGAVSNAAEVLWENVSTSETYTHFSVWDAVTGGNPLGKGALDSSVAVTAGEDARFAIGDLEVTLD